MPGAEAKLGRRVGAFLASTTGGRAEVAAFAADLARLGRVVIIGGMLRDLSLSGPRGFRSDVDFVVHPDSLEAYDRFVESRGGRPNRFGGHSVALSQWSVESWPLQRTWAAVNGHAAVGCVEDLLGITFFDWDAILYDLADGRVIAGDGYFDRLAARTLDVNFEPNPNPVANAVRALRYAHRWGARLGPRLEAHLRDQLAVAGWDGLVAYERRSFPRPCLPSLRPDGGPVVATRKAPALGATGASRDRACDGVA